jgi:iron complex outermembrane receptor protein
LAKAAAESSRDTIDEVVVTARRREESMQTVPISITAVSGEELVKRGVRDAYDLQNSVPSLTMATNSTQTKALMPGIRSVATRSFLLLDDPPVGTYFAEGAIGHPWGFGDAMFDIQSIQTLKGPQGTLFGRNTTGGAILIEPNKPSFDGFDGSVKAAVGSYNLRRTDVVLNVPLGRVAAMRIAAEHNRRDGYVTNILSGQKRDGVGNDAVRFQITFKPTENITSNTIVDYLD